MPGMLNSIPVLGTEPASVKRIRSCCGSTPGIRFYCKPVTLVRCREIRGENRFSGRVVGKWLCEMTSAFIIKWLRGARALRLFCGRSSPPPPEFPAATPRSEGFFIAHCARGRRFRPGPSLSVAPDALRRPSGGLRIPRTHPFLLTSP